VRGTTTCLEDSSDLKTLIETRVEERLNVDVPICVFVVFQNISTNSFMIIQTPARSFAYLLLGLSRYFHIPLPNSELHIFDRMMGVSPGSWMHIHILGPGDPMRVIKEGDATGCSVSVPRHRTFDCGSSGTSA
jgi:hypothetical protein